MTNISISESKNCICIYTISKTKSVQKMLKKNLFQYFTSINFCLDLFLRKFLTLNTYQVKYNR